MAGHQRRDRARRPIRDRRGRLPAHRHRRGLRKRGGCGPRARGHLGSARGRLRHHQALELRPGIRICAEGLRHEPREIGYRLRRPVFDPLAAPGQRSSATHVGRPGEDRRIRAGESVGVCNFEPHHLQLLVDRGGLLPAVDQVELHPNLPQHAIRSTAPNTGSRSSRGVRSAAPATPVGGRIRSPTPCSPTPSSIGSPIVTARARRRC